MKFARLVAEPSVPGACAAIESAERLGLVRVWLEHKPGIADPRTVAGEAEGELPLVLLVDPGEDLDLPTGDRIEPAIVGAAGWSDSLGALARGRRAWVVAGDVGTVAAAARGGVGAAMEPFENADSATDWTAEYEGELKAGSARALTGEVNAACAVFVDLPADLGEAVGLVERYRSAGVDEVILRGQHAGDEAIVAALMAEFDDDEVHREAAERAERIAPAVAAIGARGAAPAAPSAAPKAPSGFSRWIKRRQEDAVKRMSDRQLEALVGSRLGIRGLFATMAARYRPDKASGFEGEIEFTLSTKRGNEIWTINCGSAGAKARRGPSADARLHVEAKLADFLRVGTGEIPAPSAVLSGQLNIRGDFALALRMGDMFGGPRIV